MFKELRQNKNSMVMIFGKPDCNSLQLIVHDNLNLEREVVWFECLHSHCQTESLSDIYSDIPESTGQQKKEMRSTDSRVEVLPLLPLFERYFAC